MTSPISLHDALLYALKEVLELAKTNSVKSLLSKSKNDKQKYCQPKFCLAPTQTQLNLRCGDGLEFSCSGLVADHNTATLAILQTVGDDSDIAKIVRDAVSVRHALLQEHDFLQRTYSVELVFVVNVSEVNGDAAVLQRISSELQRQMTQTSYLHSVGINLLYCGSEKPSKAAILSLIHI